MKPTFIIGHLPLIDHLILGVAKQHEGDYLKHLVLNTKLFRNWDTMADALSGKQIHGAFLLFPLGIEMFRKGMDIKIVLLGHREGQVCVVDNSIRDLKDLKGKKIFIPHRFSVHYILRW